MADRDTIRLSSGREFYAHAGVLGLDADAAELLYGYDGHVGELEPPLTPAERAEIASLMIERWNRWAKAPPSNG